MIMTIKDVAEYSGVSVSSVSRVLNDHPDVSKSVRERVLEAVRVLHYVPNNSARDLSRTKIGCTGCRYCMPCPNGVNIPGVFSAWNDHSLYNADPKTDWNLNQILEHGEGADLCVSCGACEAACPQHLEIIDGLQTAWKELGQ